MRGETSVLRTALITAGGSHAIPTWLLGEQHEDLTETSKEGYENDSDAGK